MNQGTQPYSAKPGGANDPASLRRPAIATGVLVILVPVFVAAGLWQLDRAAEKTAIEDSYRTRIEAAPLGSLVPDTEIEDFRYRKLQLEGRFDRARQILLDNIVREGVPGYVVLTPFRTGNTTVMVNRGWLRANPDRRVLPVIDVSTELRSVTGVIDTFPAPGMRIAAEPVANEPWPRRMLYPTRDTIAAAPDRPVAGYQLLLADGEPDGFARTWQAVDMGVSTHYGYAGQWFSFAVITLVFYTILLRRWLKDRSKS